MKRTQFDISNGIMHFTECNKDAYMHTIIFKNIIVFVTVKITKIIGRCNIVIEKRWSITIQNFSISRMAYFLKFL